MAWNRTPKMPWEIRIVLLAVILLVLVYWVLTAGNVTMHQSKRHATAALIQALSVAAVSYQTDNGPFPKNLDNHTFWSDISGAGSGKIYMNFKPSQVNDQGELTDSWGTPLRVWYISDNEVGITSAGDDKTFGTSDDITNQ